MPQRCLLYYITDRCAFPGSESERRARLLDKISEAGRAGVDYIQLREKDLPTRELESLAAAAVSVINELRTENRGLKTALLINSRADIVLAVGADGVHLRSDDISPAEVRKIWKECGVGMCGAGTPFDKLRASFAREPVIGVSCHSPDEAIRAEHNGANFVVFAPVFEKKDTPGTAPAGLAQLREACGVKLPVLALGGVTVANARPCLEAGAAGIAGIRLFQENNIAKVVRKLRDP